MYLAKSRTSIYLFFTEGNLQKFLKSLNSHWQAFKGISSNNNCILVIDDESDIVNVIQRQLIMHGFKVCTFTDALVLEHFNSNSKDHHIVISDIRIPCMNGYEFVNQIKKINPQVKVILMSSFGIENKEFSNTLPDMNVDGFIKKPFPFESLINIIQQELSSN
jgi:DNA-binding NtrC family response regulator